ncbi:hypothetical protein CIB48_g8361 [Xylaria polymorpha]|nr:hypothetical protein CIB48_g8361 [Xylaria polymorpha]
MTMGHLVIMTHTRTPLRPDQGAEDILQEALRATSLNGDGTATCRIPMTPVARLALTVETQNAPFGRGWYASGADRAVADEISHEFVHRRIQGGELGTDDEGGRHRGEVAATWYVTTGYRCGEARHKLSRIFFLASTLVTQVPNMLTHRQHQCHFGARGRYHQHPTKMKLKKAEQEQHTPMKYVVIANATLVL